MNVSVNRLPHRIARIPVGQLPGFSTPAGILVPGRSSGGVGRLPRLRGLGVLGESRTSSGRSIGISVRFFSSITKRSVNSFLQRLRLNESRQLLIGAYFTMEYSVESAALFNPSMVPARNQGGLPEGSMRFAMSLRATGEGHVSSIVFVRGLIDKNCNIFVDERSPFLRPAKETIQPLRNEVWRQTLIAAGALSKSASKILSGLPEGFTVEELGEALEKARAEFDTPGEYEETKENLLAVAHGNYDSGSSRGRQLVRGGHFSNFAERVAGNRRCALGAVRG